jgi:hypothetical protein
MGIHHSGFWNAEGSGCDEEVKHHNNGYLYPLLHNLLATRLHNIEVLVLVPVHKGVDHGFWEQRRHNSAHVRFSKHFIHIQ